MPKFAQYDNTKSQPTAVTGWFDTDLHQYAFPPTGANSIVLTAEQWTAHFADPQAWGVEGGELVAYTAPPPVLTVAQQAGMLLASPTVAVVCASLPGVNGTYSVNPTAQTFITGVVAAINAGMGLPSGGRDFYYFDVDGNTHDWQATQFVAFGVGVMRYLYALTHAASGNGATLPSPTISIA